LSVLGSQRPNVQQAANSKDESDANLAAAVRRKDRKATAEFVSRFADGIYAYVHSRLLPRRDLVDDLVQEVFLAAWENLEQYRGTSPLQHASSLSAGSNRSSTIGSGVTVSSTRNGSGQRHDMWANGSTPVTSSRVRSNIEDSHFGNTTLGNSRLGSTVFGNSAFVHSQFGVRTTLVHPFVGKGFGFRGFGFPGGAFFPHPFLFGQPFSFSTSFFFGPRFFFGSPFFVSRPFFSSIKVWSFSSGMDSLLAPVRACRIRSFSVESLPL